MLLTEAVAKSMETTTLYGQQCTTSSVRPTVYCEHPLHKKQHWSGVLTGT